MWQALETKARFIGRVITGDNAARRAEDTAMRPVLHEPASEVALIAVEALTCGAIACTVSPAITSHRSRRPRERGDRPATLSTLGGRFNRRKHRFGPLEK